jgi:hypothetical protein
MKIILTQNGGPITTMAADPTKSEAPSGELEASGTEHSSLESIDAHIVQAVQRQRKAFFTMQAEFARVGFELKSKHHPAGLTLFEVSRHGQARIFSAWHDVGAFLAQLQGARHG